MDRFTPGMPYGSTEYPYSASRPHRGTDFKAPYNTPVLVELVTIGLVGSTGLSIGPHLHIQAWVGDVANTRDPAPYMFRPGTVIKVGEASEWGKYVTILVEGVNVTYCHLNQICVTVGQVIGASMDSTSELGKEEATMLAEMAYGYKPSDEDVKALTGVESNTAIRRVYESQTHKDYVQSVEDLKAAASSDCEFEKVEVYVKKTK